MSGTVPGRSSTACARTWSASPRSPTYTAAARCSSGRTDSARGAPTSRRQRTCSNRRCGRCLRAENPHLAAPAVVSGAALERAQAVAILLCGRDQEAEFMLEVAGRIGRDHAAYLVLEAGDRSWDPGRRCGT